MFFDPPGGTAASAVVHRDQVLTPLTTTVTAGP